jgi:hypothetical protein
MRPAYDDCARPSDRSLPLLPDSHWAQTAVEIDWLGASPPQHVFTCEHDPNGFVPVADQALQALHLDPNGHRIESAATP